MSKESRNPPGASTVYKGADGYWHARVTVGRRDDGRTDRRHVMARTKGEINEKKRKLEALRDSGQLPKPGASWTMAKWLEHWLDAIARPSIRESSYNAYRIAITKHLVPGIGSHRLDRLQPEHLERLYRKMIEAGARPATAHQVHRTARVALGEAQSTPRSRRAQRRCSREASEEQDRERSVAAQLWHEEGWLFASPLGAALNPNSDYHAWKALLKRAGVRDGRLHDARHTAATVLLILGVPERTVMSIMGWSSTAMAARYQHVTDPIRRDVATRVGGLLWSDDTENTQK